VTGDEETMEFGCAHVERHDLGVIPSCGSR
jgi:hypothetical protein